MSFPLEKYMKHALLIFMFLMICGNPGASLSATPPPWPPAVLANTDKMIENGLSREEIMAVTQAMVQARFEEQYIISLQNAVMQAYNQGLPTAPLNDKILEGIAKHAPPPSIIMAMARITNRYTHALQLATQLTGEKSQINQWGALIATGNAAGLPFEDLEKILHQIQARSTTENEKKSNLFITQTLTTARDMARQTVTPEAVTKIIGIAIAKGFNGNEMQELNRTFSTHARQNSLEIVTRNCLMNLARGNSPTEALHNFGSGNGNGGAGSKGPGNGNLDSSRGNSNDNSGSANGGSGDTGGTSGGNNANSGPSGNGGGESGSGNGNGGGNGQGR